MARYYRSDQDTHHAVSTEITGYAASTLAYLHERTGRPEYREAACRAGRFLTRVAWSPALGTFPFEMAANGDRPTPAYFFDIGIILRGLLALWRLTGDAEFLEAARRGGEALASDFARSGDIPPILALPGKEPMAYGDTWSRRPGCYQLKSAMAWRELSEACGEPSFRRHYEDALTGALATHESFLPGAGSPETVMDRLHAYCYFLEGLCPAAERPECAHALADGTRRAASLLGEIAPRFVRSDVYAQLLRIRLIADRLGAVPLDLDAASGEAAALPDFQASSDSSRVDGGFLFGRKEGADLPYINPASTAFAIQALEMWRQHQAGTLEPGFRQLI